MELDSQRGSLKQTSLSLQAKEKSLKEEEARIAECGVLLHQQEKVIAKEKKSLEMKKQEFVDSVSELEKHMQFIANERESL